MDNYQQTTVSGDSWLRAKRIVIDNELGETAMVRFVEEKIINTDTGDTFKKDTGVLEVPATQKNMDTVIPIIELETGRLMGHKMTYKEVYEVIKSAYIHFAQQRDNPPVEEAVEAPAEPTQEEPTNG